MLSAFLLNSALGFIHIVLVKHDQVVWSEQQPSTKETDRLIFHQIDEALRQSQLTLQDFDYYAVVQGPGSYAGIRIGFSVIKTFAMMFQKPLIGLQSLDLLASHYQESSFDVLLNCARSEVFHAKYQQHDGQAVAMSQTQMTTLEKLPCELLENPVALYRMPSASRRFDSLFNSVVSLTPHQTITNDQLFFKLAQATYDQAKQVGFPDIQPIYLKKEVDWKK